MSRSRTRAHRRHVRKEALRHEFDSSRAKPENFAKLLAKLSDSNTPIWPIVKSLDVPLDDAEEAMVEQAVAPHLVRMTPGTSRRSIEGQRDERYITLISRLKSRPARMETGEPLRRSPHD